MANVLPREKRLEVLAALVEGNSECAVERMTDVNARTISKLAATLGGAAQSLHNRLVRDLHCSAIEFDEIWSYIGKKQARIEPSDPAWYGDAYTFVALDKVSRLVIAFYVGKRDEASARAFMADLRARLLVMPVLTSDGLPAYIGAVWESFGPGVSYGQTIKNYRSGGRRDDDHRYEPPRDPFVTKKAIFGAPDLDRATTAHIERQNGTMRHHIGRIRRLVYAYSKRQENHAAAVALNYCWYNLGHIIKTTRVTPAMAAGVTDHVWTLEEYLDTLLAEVPCERPEKKPLRHLVPEGTSRELPGGRGFLRALPGGKSAPGPAPATPPAAPAVAPVEPAADPTGQLDLLAWKPRPAPPPTPREPIQLDLFGEPPAPPKV